MNTQSGPQGGFVAPLGYLAFPFGHQLSNPYYDGLGYCAQPGLKSPIQPNVGNPQWPTAFPGPPTPGGPTSKGGW